MRISNNVYKVFFFPHKQLMHWHIKNYYCYFRLLEQNFFCESHDFCVVLIRKFKIHVSKLVWYVVLLAYLLKSQDLFSNLSTVNPIEIHALHIPSLIIR